MGGWKRVWASLKPQQAVFVALRLTTAADELAAKTKEVERKQRAMIKDAARDPSDGVGCG